MENKEKRNNENKSEEKDWGKSFFGWPSMPEAMAKCCEGMREPSNSRSMMDGCMKMCRWFPLIPVVLGIAFLLLGYYLDGEILRVLWMIFAGCAVLMGTFGLILMGAMRKACY